MPQYNDILINNYLKFDKENFDELAKFVKFVKIFLCQNFTLYGSGESEQICVVINIRQTFEGCRQT